MRGFFADKHVQPASDFNYRDYLAAKGRGGQLGYYQLFRDWHTTFTIAQASVLGHLVNYGRVRSDSEGWFLCTAGFLRRAFFTDEAEEILDSLIRDGVVEIKRLPKGRHVRVNVAKLPA